ncbi:serine hydrolase domain-containing protein [Amycolatopsis umgeniensis]|uniref:CubicO group peptidase (Beta-lactamase class C family) n=1 Tax=Amycolatopsis umgeniensis TaxID=336628 RepID=A0A841BFL9_9PSEU|nr:serine hydrolase domain-containing protein [Amycolatopsis umgeniensis]MBB5857513.1 CubicO group peptidase (beta-lactamase class C family) [Amycolatopsis umgeniensis]
MPPIREGYDRSSRNPVTATHFHEVLARLAGVHGVPGAQLAILRDGTKTVVQTGVEHQERRRPMDAASAVPIGSITKLATATVAMVLVADDDLELDQPAGEVLGVTGLDDRFTPRRLLSHTSGLPSDPADVTAACLREVRGADLVCPPGSAFSYSNLGYALVGSLIESVTGMTWREAVEAILLRPSKIEPAYAESPRTVSGHGHATGQGGARPIEQALPPLLEPAGALALSAGDLVELGRVHLGKPGLLDVVTAADMHGRVPGAEPFGLADGWGLGIAHYDGEDDVWLGHDGTADGTSCHLRIDQAGACVVAFTANGAAGTRMWQDLSTELRALGLELPDQRPRAITRPVPIPAGDFGTYRNGAIDYTIRADEDGGTVLVVDGEVFPDLTLHEDATIAVRDPATGDATPCGRLRGTSGEATAIEVGGRLAGRR